MIQQIWITIMNGKFQKGVDDQPLLCYTKDAPERKDRGKPGPRLVMTNLAICGKDNFKKIEKKC